MGLIIKGGNSYLSVPIAEKKPKRPLKNRGKTPDAMHFIPKSFLLDRALVSVLGCVLHLKVQGS